MFLIRWNSLVRIPCWLHFLNIYVLLPLKQEEWQDQDGLQTGVRPRRPWCRLRFCWSHYPWSSSGRLWGLAGWLPDDNRLRQIQDDPQQLCYRLQDWWLPAPHQHVCLITQNRTCEWQRIVQCGHSRFPGRKNGSEFDGSIYQKVNDELETAVNLAWTAGSSGTRFGIAAKYQLDSNASLSVRKIYLTYYINIDFSASWRKQSKWDSFFFLHNSMFYFQAKVNNASLVGIGYTQTLRPGKEDPSSITLITTDGTFNPSLFQYLICLIVFCARNESNPLCTCGWEEYQCRWPQTWSWIGIGGMRRTFCLFRVQQE